MKKKSNEEDQTPLHYAAKFGSSEVLRCLIIECRADKEAKDHWNRTPLYIAAEFCKHTKFYFLN